jgi:hypothetical protein
LAGIAKEALKLRNPVLVGDRIFAVVRSRRGEGLASKGKRLACCPGRKREPRP